MFQCNNKRCKNATDIQRNTKIEELDEEDLRIGNYTQLIEEGIKPWEWGDERER